MTAHGDAGRRGQRQHSPDNLPLQRGVVQLPLQRGVVQAAFSRDHEVSACDGVLEALFGRHQVEPPDDLAPQRR
jgi:hypothetical protein